MASGNTGCNNYSAQVIADERGILLEQINSSKKACEPTLADLEYKFLGYLSSYRTLIRDGDRMLLMTRDGEVLSFALRTQ
jgi:heat shock protein HslJ